MATTPPLLRLCLLSRRQVAHPIFCGDTTISKFGGCPPVVGGLWQRLGTGMDGRGWWWQRKQGQRRGGWPWCRRGRDGTSTHGGATTMTAAGCGQHHGGWPWQQHWQDGDNNDNWAVLGLLLSAHGAPKRGWLPRRYGTGQPRKRRGRPRQQWLQDRDNNTGGGHENNVGRMGMTMMSHDWMVPGLLSSAHGRGGTDKTNY